MAPRRALAAATALNAVMVCNTTTVLAVPVMAPAIAADTGLPVSLLGAYSFVMWGAALLASTLVGELIARFRPVRVEQIALALCVIALALGATGSITALFVAPALMGLACGIETPASSDILARLTPAAHRTFIFSLKQTGVQIGGMLAGILLPSALPMLGWRGVMGVLAVAIAAYAIGLQSMRRRLDLRAPSPRPAGVAPIGLVGVLRSPALRDLAAASFAFHAMQVCMNTFLVAYLVGEHGYSLTTAGLLFTLAQLGGFFGRLGFGLLVGPRLGVVPLLSGIGFGMAAAGLATALVAGMLPLVVLALLCFLFGLTAAGWNGVFLAEVARHAPPGEIARVTGGVMVTAYAGLILGPVVFSATAAAATLGAGYALLAGTTLAGTLFLRHGMRRL